MSVDWNVTFLPAVLAFLRGGVPSGFYNPPWVLFPLIPFAALPYEVGRLLWLAFSILAFGIVAIRLGAKAWAVGLLILSYPVLNSLAWGNVEPLALLGLAMPLPVGLIFFAIKPQVTFGVVVFAFARLAMKRKWKKMILALIPLLVMFALSMVLFGAWWTRTLSYLQFANTNGNTSLFPYSIPLGLVLLIYAIRHNELRWAVAASPLFFPVLTITCWVTVMLALVSSLPTLTFSSVAWWVTALTRK